MTKAPDYPLEDIAAECLEHFKAGRIFHQKFTCSKCGTRQTMEKPDTIYAAGTCEQCGHVTDLRQHGCNYLLVLGAKRNDQPEV